MNQKAIPQQVLKDLRREVVELISQSTAPEAVKLDIDAWLALWLERPQPALGGKVPRELLDTPEGVAAVKRLLGAISSGSYQ